MAMDSVDVSSNLLEEFGGTSDTWGKGWESSAPTIEAEIQAEVEEDGPERDSRNGGIKVTESYTGRDKMAAANGRPQGYGGLGGDGDGGVGSGWGWSGWARSLVSTISEAATEAAEDISRTAAARMMDAAKSLTELQQAVASVEDSTTLEKSGIREEGIKKVEDAEEVKKRKTALEKLEKASKDSLLGQGLTVFDNSVHNFTSGAMQALGTAWKESYCLVQKLEHARDQLAETMQQVDTQKLKSTAGGLVEGGRALAARSTSVLESVGKHAIELLADEVGMPLEREGAHKEDGDTLSVQDSPEEVNFARCFYIYEGADHLEELEALANHYTLLCNRARAKLQGEERAQFDATLLQLQDILNLERDDDAEDKNMRTMVEKEKGKEKEKEESDVDILEQGAEEVRILKEASVSKAAAMANGFPASLTGLGLAEMVQRTVDRLEAIKAEGIHRISELCSLCAAQILHLGKSVLASVPASDETGGRTQNPDDDSAGRAFVWPANSFDKARLIRERARTMAEDIELVFTVFLTGILDVVAAFESTTKKIASSGGEVNVAMPSIKIRRAKQEPMWEGSVEDHAAALRSDLESDGGAAISRLQDGVQQLLYVVLSTTLKPH